MVMTVLTQARQTAAWALSTGKNRHYRRFVSRYDGSTGTLIHLPDLSAVQDADGLYRAGLKVIDDDLWNNPLAWLQGPKGTVVRIMRADLRSPGYATWGGIDWQNESQREAVLSFAEAAAKQHPEPLVRPM